MRLSVCLGALFISFLLIACGGGGGSANSSTPIAANPPQSTVLNIQTITVNAGLKTYAGSNQPVRIVNLPYITITICQPRSSTQCQTIDNILIDTNSSGLRIVSSVLSGTIVLPALTDGSGNPIAECARFADGYTWGSVKQADVHIAGEIASGISIQLIGDSTFPNVPSSCSNSLAAEDTVATFRANGLIGLGPFMQDCGSVCASQALAVLVLLLSKWRMHSNEFKRYRAGRQSCSSLSSRQ